MLALLHPEPGGETIPSILLDCAISTVNLSEIIAKLVDNGTYGDTAGRVDMVRLCHKLPIWRRIIN